MKIRQFLVFFTVGLFIISIVIIVSIYYYLPIEDVVTRQLLFGMAFQIWGIIVTVLVVKKLLDMRETQRWKAINMYVLGPLYQTIFRTLDDLFNIFGVKIETKQKEIIEESGVKHENLGYFKERNQKTIQELEQIVKRGPELIKTNMKNWQPSTHLAFSKTMKDFGEQVKNSLTFNPQQIPPEFLTIILNVRGTALGFSNPIFSAALTDENLLKELNTSYKAINASWVDLISKDVYDFFVELLRLVKILEENVSSEWK